MKLRTLIIDYEPIALGKLRSYVGKVPFLELVAECHSAFDAIDVIAKEHIDLVFTDIEMPDMNGMEFVKTLSTVPMIVFTTAYSQYAADSYKMAAVDYLLKPYDFVDFQRAANKAMELYASRHQKKSTPLPQATDSLFLKVDYRYVRVALAEIRYVKGYGEYLQIFVTGNAAPLMTLSSFSAIMERLSDNFLQVHRSFIVNMNQVERIERSRIIMDKDTFIPVGDSFKADLQKYLQDHAIGKAASR